jgi:hypothetical protein
MKTPHLIQRANIREGITQGQIQGPDTLLSYDYMGRSEFEWGVMPKSLNAILAELDSYQIFKTEFKDPKGQGLFVFCRAQDHEELMGWITRLANLEFTKWDPSLRPLEPPFMAEALGVLGTSFSPRNLPSVWWDAENHWLACLGKQNTKWIQLAMQRLRERRAVTPK